MQTLHKAKLVSSASLLVMAMAGAAHSASINSEISTSVEGVFSVAMDTPLSFGVGSISAASKAADTASIVLGADGSVTANDGTKAKASIITPGAPGIIKVENALPGLDVTVSATDSQMGSVGNGEAKVLDITTFTFAYSNTDPGDPTQGRTDANGNLDISIGATLATQDSGVGTPAGDVELKFADGAYEGVIEVSVTY